MRRALRKSLCVLLCFALLYPAFVRPAQILAEDIANRPRQVDFSLPQTNTVLPEVSEPAEAEAKAPEGYYSDISANEEPPGKLTEIDEYSKTYQTGTNTFVTEASGIREAYIDEEGNLTEVDETLQAARSAKLGEYYENTAGPFSAKFPVNLAEGQGIVVEKDGRKVELIPVGGDFSRSAAEANAIRYTEAYPGVDFEYTVIGDLVKEDIVLTRYIESPSFSFEIKAPGMKAEIEDGGAVVLTDEKTGEELFSIAPPMMIDASGVASLLVTAALEIKGGKNILTITPDSEWLSEANRAYPVRIDPTIVTVALSKLTLVGVEQGSPNLVVGDNQYPYAGYDDGIVSSNLILFGNAHLTTRTYIGVHYEFLKVPKDARIESATLKIHHYTAWSGGGTNFGLYRAMSPWEEGTLTWQSQVAMEHEYLSSAMANPTAGYLTFDVREAVNNWVQGIWPDYGLVIKAINESDQCEVFSNKTSAYPPELRVEWSIPDPVDTEMSVDSTTVNLRPVTEKSISGKQVVDGVFPDGIAKPGSILEYRLLTTGGALATIASYQYKYPDSEFYESVLPDATEYKDKLSNWQGGLFINLENDYVYQYGAKATYFDEDTDVTSTGIEATSDTFLIYKVKQKDTLPYIANYYGVNLDTLMKDNHVQDTLAVENNTLFIRNPKTSVPYNPEPLNVSQMTDIDRALIGRGLHCEYGYEPVNLNTGNFIMEQTDTTIPEIEGSFDIFRTYNSLGENANSIFGRRWSFGYAESLGKREDGSILYQVGDGKTLVFTPDGEGGYIAPVGYELTLTEIPYTENDTDYVRYEIEKQSGAVKKFNAWGLLTEDVSEKGLSTVISYDADYRMAAITSPTGKTYAFSYNQAGYVSQITLPDTNSLKYEYDSSGNLTSFTDAEGGVTTYIYAANGLMIEAKDANDDSFVRNTYDEQGRVIKQLTANGDEIMLSYTDTGTEATDANGNTTIYTVDEMKRTTKIEYPDGQIIEMRYNADNNLVKEDDLTYGYDTKGNRISETRIDGAVRTWEYDAKGNVIKSTDYDGAVTLYEYSLEGDLLSVVYPDKSTAGYSYDAMHRLTGMTDGEGSETLFSYDGAMPVSMTDANGETWRFGYDAMNRSVSSTDPEGNTNRTIYNRRGDVVGEQDANGEVVSYQLDGVGQVTQYTDARGYVTTLERDAAGNLLKITGPKGNSLSYTYDANDNKTSETDALGNVTTFSYDSRNRLTKETDAEGNVTTYSYDLKGRLAETTNALGAVTSYEYSEALNVITKATDALGNETVYAYDLTGRLLSVSYPDGTSESFSYDLNGNLTQYRSTDGILTELTYDKAGNIIAKTVNGAREYLFEYDPVGNLLSETNPLGEKTVYGYDRAGRLTSTTDASGNMSSLFLDGKGQITKAVDALGNVTEIIYDAAGNVLKIIDANGGETSYLYDELGCLISAIDAEGGITNYEYDQVQNLITVTDALSGKKQFSYDSLSRAVSMTDEAGNVWGFSYDALGNITETVLPTGDKQTQEYDLLGRLIKTTDAYGVLTELSYDAVGNVLTQKDSSGNTLTYSYDSYGRVSKITDESGRTETNEYNSYAEILRKKYVDNTVETYAYDLLGRVTSVTDALGGKQSISYDAAGNVSSLTTARGGVYSFSFDSVGNLLSQKDPEGGRTEYVYDPVGNIIATKDANSQTISYSYDKLSRLVSETSPRGAETEYSYDALSRLLSVTDPEGGVTEYRYDPLGNLTKVKDPVGNITEYVYDSLSNPTKEISPRGAVTSYEYDLHGYVTVQTDALGNETKYEVLPNGLVSSITEANGAKYTYSYDAAERLTGITTPLGLSRTFLYNESGDLVTETDNLGREQQYSYDALHNLVSSVNPLGGESAFSYDAAGNLVSQTLANGATESYSYDLLERLTSTTDALGKVSSAQYDPVGNLTSVTLPGGRTAAYSYDADGNLTAVTNALGNTSTVSYDLAGRVTAVTDALGNSSGFTYDAAGRVTKQTDAEGQSLLLSYDPDGNLTKVTNRLGGEISYSYDLLGNLTAVKDELGNVTRYSYDSVGNLTAVQDAEGKMTSYSYDLEGNLTSVTDPEGGVKAFSYDIAGRLTQAVRPSGATVKYDYNKLNEIISKEYAGEEEQNVVIGYDKMGNRVSMSDASGDTEYEYDLMGRITKVTNGSGLSVRYEYGENDQISRMVYSDGTTVSYGYDKNGNMTSVTDAAGTVFYDYDVANRLVAVRRPGNVNTSYAYNSQGNITRVENTGPGETLSTFSYEFDAEGNISKETAEDSSRNWSVKSFSYDSAGQLTGINERSSDGNFKYSFEYSEAGNRTKQVRTGTGENETITYEYDKANRLTVASSSLTGKTLFSYDSDGNLISKEGAGELYTYEYSVDSRLAAVREGGALLMAAAYDGDGNRVFTLDRSSGYSTYYGGTGKNSVTTYGAIDGKDSATGSGKGGEITEHVNLWYIFLAGCSIGVETMSRAFISPHSEFGQVVHEWPFHIAAKAITYEGAESSVSDLQTLTLTEDEFRAAVATAIVPANWQRADLEFGYELTYYLNDVNTENAQVLQEYSVGGTTKASYTYGQSGRVSADFHSYQEEIGTGAKYYLTDGRGSVAQVTSSTGTILSSYEYGPFGEVLSGSTAEDSFYGYNAEEYNPQTELVYLRARYYNPSDGRFGVEDTYGGNLSNPATLNRYAYVENNPVNKTDPSGYLPTGLSHVNGNGNSSSSSSSLFNTIFDTVSSIVKPTTTPNYILNPSPVVTSRLEQSGFTAATSAAPRISNPVSAAVSTAQYANMFSAYSNASVPYSLPMKILEAKKIACESDYHVLGTEGSMQQIAAMTTGSIIGTGLHYSDANNYFPFKEGGKYSDTDVAQIVVEFVEAAIKVAPKFGLGLSQNVSFPLGLTGRITYSVNVSPGENMFGSSLDYDSSRRELSAVPLTFTMDMDKIQVTFQPGGTFKVSGEVVTDDGYRTVLNGTIDFDYQTGKIEYGVTKDIGGGGTVESKVTATFVAPPQIMNYDVGPVPGPNVSYEFQMAGSLEENMVAYYIAGGVLLIYTIAPAVVVAIGVEAIVVASSAAYAY